MIKRNKREVAELFAQRQSTDKYYTPKDLSEELGYKNASRVYQALKAFNITYAPNDKNKKLHRSFNQEVMTGNLLGDGFIYYSTKQSNYPVFSVEYKHKEYCNYIQRVNPFLRGQQVKYRERFDNRYISGKIEQYKCTSLSSSVLKELHTKWYIDGTKEVPEDIVITPQTMLIWFMDDGFKTSSCGGLSIATDGFSLQSNEILKARLEDYGLHINFHKASSRNNVRLYISAKTSIDFLNIIGPCPVDCYKYKWK